MIKLSSFYGFIFLLANPSFALDADLPATQQVHILNIETEEDVNIRVNSDAWIEGSIKTDGSINISGYGAKHFNSGLVIDGYKNEEPLRFNVFGMGDIFIHTPIATEELIQTFPVFGSSLEVYADLTSRTLSVTGPNDGTYVGPNVTLYADSIFHSDNYDGSFYLSPNSTIQAGRGVNVIGNNGITLDGTIISDNHVQINGSTGGIGSVSLNGPIMTTEGNFAGAFISAGELSLRSTIELGGNVFIRADVINNYGSLLMNEIDGDNVQDSTITLIGKEAINSYGGSIVAYEVCLSGPHNDYGLIVNSIISCDNF